MHRRSSPNPPRATLASERNVRVAESAPRRGKPVFAVADGGYHLVSGLGPIWEFNAGGTLINTFNVAGDSSAPAYLDLAADQRTLYYTSFGAGVERYDTVAQAQLPDAVSNLTADNIYTPYAVRLLSDGSLLVAGGSGEIVARFGSAGNLVQNYTATNASGDLAILALDPDGQSFLASTYFNPAYLYKFSFSAGTNVLQMPTFLPGGAGSSAAQGSFAIYGEPRVAIPSVPLLSVGASARNVVISWPAGFSGFTLQATPTLTSPNWTDVTTSTNSITLPATNTTRFFRLFRP